MLWPAAPDKPGRAMRHGVECFRPTRRQARHSQIADQALSTKTDFFAARDHASSRSNKADFAEIGLCWARLVGPSTEVSSQIIGEAESPAQPVPRRVFQVRP